MSHIFEISRPDSFIRFEGKDYKIQDPGFTTKVLFQEETEKLEEAIKDKPSGDQQRARRENNKKMIQKFLPDMPTETLDGLSDSGFALFLEAITRAAMIKFGASVKEHEGPAHEKK